MLARSGFRAFPLWVLFYVFGIVIGRECNISLLISGIVGICASICFVLAFLLKRGQGLCLLTLSFSLGMYAQGTANPLWQETEQIQSLMGLTPKEQKNRWAEPPCYEGVVIEGFQTGPQKQQIRIQIERMGFRTTSSSNITSQTIKENNARTFYTISPTFEAWVLVQGKEFLLPGDFLRLCTHLHKPQSFLNPGSLDFFIWTRHQGIQAVGSIASESLVRFPEKSLFQASHSWPNKSSFWFHSWILLKRSLYMVQKQASQKLKEALPSQITEYALLASLVLGERGALEEAQEERVTQGHKSIDQAFRDAGIYHVLSVSGFHLTVVTYLFYVLMTGFFLRVLRWPFAFPAKRVGALLSIGVTILYTLLTGAEVATIRAAAMASFGFAAIVCGYRAKPAELVAFAVFFILCPLGTPLALFDPSFQLSLSAVLGLMYLRPLQSGKEFFLKKGWFQNQASFFPQEKPQKLLVRWRVLHKLWQGLDVTLGALLPTVPLCALYFSQFQAAGIFGNLLALPFGEFWVLPVGCVGVLICYLWPWLGTLIVKLAGLGATILIKITDLLAHLPLSFYIPTPPMWILMLWFLGLILFSWQKWLGKWLCLVAFGCYIGSWFLPSSTVTVTFLDIGQGDASVIRLPQGQIIVIDGGPNQGEQVLLPFLHSQGYQKIDLMIVSHPHPDHVQGLIQVIEQMPVTEIWTAEPVNQIDQSAQRHQKTSAYKENETSAWRQFLTIAKKKQIPIRFPEKRMWDQVVIEPLGPCKIEQEVPLQIEKLEELHNPEKKDKKPFPSLLTKDPSNQRLASEALPIPQKDGLPITFLMTGLHSLENIKNYQENKATLQKIQENKGFCAIEANPTQGANDNSVIIRLTYAGKSILFPGDIEKLGEQHFLEKQETDISLHADVMKAPHHCSKTSSSLEFVQAVSPQQVICSVGRENRFGFPHAEVVKRYQEHGISILRTDQMGSIQVSLERNGTIQIKTQSK